MGLPKGRTNNSKGRKKGSENKVTKELRPLIQQFLEEKFLEVKREWSKLDSKDKLQFYKDLLKYAIPTLQATQIDLEVENKVTIKHLILQPLTKEELKQFNEILEKNV